jgi:hypothetical protein
LTKWCLLEIPVFVRAISLVEQAVLVGNMAARGLVRVRSAAGQIPSKHGRGELAYSGTISEEDYVASCSAQRHVAAECDDAQVN